MDNTDAEGRLILADALTYADQQTPAPYAVIDVATLTGGMTTALGGLAIGAYVSEDKFWDAIQTAGYHTGERLWRMPLWPEYKKLISSPVADLRNVGPGQASSNVAAIFLRQFTKATRWAHLDIASVMTASSHFAPRYQLSDGATGQPVRTLVRLIEQEGRALINPAPAPSAPAPTASTSTPST